jgi:glycosyltransferase involved in cell wall biosynthesis
VTEKRTKALFLATWYPRDENPFLGIFIKRHAEAVSRYCDVAVLHVQFSRNTTSHRLEYSVEDGIKTVRASVRARGPLFAETGIFASLARIIAFVDYLLCSRRALKEMLKQFGRPDIVHINVMSIIASIALFLNLTRGIPFVLSEHSTAFRKDAGSAFSRTLTRVVLARAKVVMPVSVYLKKQMQGLYHNARYEIVPNAVDTHKFRHNAHIKNNKTKKEILHVSLLRDSQKNISGILRAAQALSHKRQDFEVIVVGEGEGKENLERLASDLGILNKFVFFAGRLSEPDLIKHMQRSDFFVLNSNVETFSVACAESLACGLPVVCTRCGGPEDYVNDDVGIMIEPRDDEALLQAMELMVENSWRFDPRKLHDYIESRFSYEVVGRELFKHYLTAINAISSPE